MPNLVVHADWSVNPEKRRMACAVLRNGTYHIDSPVEVGDPETLLRRLGEATPQETVLAGFDFPIGLPGAYAKHAGVERFREFLADLAGGRHSEFWHPATQPGEISSARPFYPKVPAKGTRKNDLAAALGVPNVSDLLRQCERGHGPRPSAECMFWLVGPKQVGRAMLHGWQSMLLPGLQALGDRVGIWPFDGRFDALIGVGRVIVVETYPAEYYEALGVNAAFRDRRLSGGSSGKGNREPRQSAACALLKWAGRRNIACSPDLCARLRDGFGQDPNGEDDFEAVVGLLGMLGVILGCRAPVAVVEDGLLQVEGWIFGQESSAPN